MNALSILTFVLCPQYSVNFVPNLVVLLDRIIIGGGHVAWRRNINRIRLIRIDISSLNSSGLCSFGISRWHTRRNCKSTSSSCIGSISRITINSWMKENSMTIGFVLRTTRGLDWDSFDYILFTKNWGRKFELFGAFDFLSTF